MCFDAIRPTFFQEDYRLARKPHVCCECGMPIAKGERHLHVAGKWDGDFSTYRICLFCDWLRERVADAENNAGCRAEESVVPFGCLDEALDDGHGREIGLFALGIGETGEILACNYHEE